MPDNLHPIFSAILAPHRPSLDAEPVTVETADGFLVVAWWSDPASVVPPYRGSWDYRHFETLNEAADYFAELEAGELRGFRPHHILPCKGGVPIGAIPRGPVDLAKLVREYGGRNA